MPSVALGDRNAGTLLALAETAELFNATVGDAGQPDAGHAKSAKQSFTFRFERQVEPHDDRSRALQESAHGCSEAREDKVNPFILMVERRPRFAATQL